MIVNGDNGALFQIAFQRMIADQGTKFPTEKEYEKLKMEGRTALGKIANDNPAFQNHVFVQVN